MRRMARWMALGALGLGGVPVGVWGSSGSNIGVAGLSDTKSGVYGESYAPDESGVFGIDTTGVGVKAIFGVLGTLSRYGMQGWVQNQSGSLFPTGTLAVNLLGCLLIGAINRIIIPDGSISTLRVTRAPELSGDTVNVVVGWNRPMSTL